MADSRRGTRTDEASRVVNASAGEVYAALTQAGAVERWLPPGDMTGEVHELDARPGGRFRMTLTYTDAAGTGRGKATDDTDVVEAEFAELVPGERVVQMVRFDSDNPAFAGVMRMSWLLEPVAGGTKVTIRAEDVPPGITKEDHDAGLRSSLENLGAYLG